jgi:uncharacterized protein DUF3168
MIEAGLVSLLQADGTLTGLIGARLYPVLVPENSAYPCLSYQAVSGSAETTLEPKEALRRRYQFDAWGLAFLDCLNVQNALRNILFGYCGVLSDGTRVLSVERGAMVDGFEADARCYRALREFHFFFVES